MTQKLDSVALKTLAHRRLNPLTGEWLLVSPQRVRRPWQGQQEPEAEERRARYDPECYLCPGNPRAGGARNPPYESTFVFTNDFPALTPGERPPRPEGASLAPLHWVTDISPTEPGLLEAAAVAGTCRVVCFSPRHDLTLADMESADVRRVVDVWAAETEALGGSYRWVQAFENKGAAMGCSNPHPHGQIWALDALPTEPAKEERTQKEYFARHGEPLLAAYARLEAARGERVVEADEHWLAVVPYWAFWPFETLLLPRRHVARLPDLTADERTSLAAVLGRLLRRYDRLFSCSFPYSMGWHGAPYGGDTSDNEHWQLHAHFYPPLLRSSTVRKFRVGYEMLGEPQRDLTAEQAAEWLRRVDGGP
jgi:UDPglucose--hexose-1-phosphate uridylyltransferase